MAGASKKRTPQHVIDTRGQHLFKSKIPDHWVVRDYRPDYGIDFSIEVFDDPHSQSGSPDCGMQTLGEHLLIQLKSTQRADEGSLKVYGRMNVEKHPLAENRDDVTEIRVIRKTIETSELMTAHRMGSALPLLLVIADVTSEMCYFVCLNDYIDKILVPAHESFASGGSRVVHLPARNTIGDNELGVIPLRWYAKRPKLYAAFQKFHYQWIELQHAFESDNFIPMARHFASLLEGYDFWETTEMWAILSQFATEIRKFVIAHDYVSMRETTQPATGDDARMQASDDMQFIDRKQLSREHIMSLWRRLSVLPRTHEEVCREWYLPTRLGMMTSDPH